MIEQSGDAPTANEGGSHNQHAHVTPANGQYCGCATTTSAPVVGAQQRFPAPITATMPSAIPAFVYAIGNVEARFPTLSVEKEFAQATRGTNTAGLSDQQTFQAT